MLLIFCVTIIFAQAFGGGQHHGVNVFVSYNFPEYNIGVTQNGEVYIVSGKLHQFAVVPALNGRDGAYSLQSVERPEHYLRHRNFLVHLDASDGSELFKNDASFFMRANKYFPGYTSLESCNFPGHFLRHQNYKMKLHKEDSSQLFKMDASFLSSSVSWFAKLDSKNFPGFYWGVTGINARITKDHQISVQLLMPGLTGQEGTISFHVPSTGGKSKYLRHRNYLFRAEGDTNGAELFRKDSTYHVRMDKWFPGYLSFESVNFPNYFIRHQNFLLRISKFDNTALFKNDASFEMKMLGPGQ